jgi:hypothetical protein
MQEPDSQNAVDVCEETAGLSLKIFNSFCQM